MAKQMRRVSARKMATLKRRKGGKRAAPARKKTAKRAVRKTTAKKLAKRAARKKPAAPKPRQKPVVEIIEDTVVELIEQPVPGVAMVTELEEVRTIRPPEREEGAD